MADCSHEIHKAAMELLENGQCHAVQCLKCGASLKLEDLKQTPSEDDDEQDLDV